MEYENNDKKIESVFSSKIRAGKRRTYFFDVRATKANDYFLTITESRKRFDDNGYDRHKLFLYKEDFNKFLKALTESIDYVKTELMPDFDFDAFNHEFDPEQEVKPFVSDAPETQVLPTSSSISERTTINEGTKISEGHPDVPNEQLSNASNDSNDLDDSNTSNVSNNSNASSGDNLSAEEVDKW